MIASPSAALELIASGWGRNVDVRSLPSVVLAGVAYFAVAFAAGFALGTLRVLIAIPRLGETAAVLIELPVMLTITWIACRTLVTRFQVPPVIGSRLLMGALALAMLMVAEFGVSVFEPGRTFSDHLASYRHASTMLGLAAQLLFAAFPAVQVFPPTTSGG